MYPIPEDEAERLELLSACALTGRPARREFDEITRLAAELFDAPIALVTLVTEHEQWLHGRTGLQVDGTRRDVSFCAHAIASDRPFIVTDAAADPRFAENVLVTGEPYIRFYAGAPITTRDGVRVGAVCVIDREPRPHFKSEEARPLVRLARMVARSIEARRHENEGKAVGSFAEATALAILTTDAEGVITSWNGAAERMFGYLRMDAVGRSMDLIIPERFHDAHHAGLERVKRGGETKLVGKTVEVTARRADGEEFPIELSISAWPTPAGVALGAHAQDVSVRHARDAALEHLAAHDQLTGLLNPKAFRERLRQRLDDGRSAAVLAFDLDGFKAVNDSLGHDVGDALLQALAIRLRSATSPDWVIGRLGGDEFAVLLSPEADLFTAREAACALLGAFVGVFHVAGHRLNLAASIGVALVPDHADDADELMMRADLAMFRAKRGGGRGYRLFDGSMRAELAARRAFNEELRQAQISNQWELHYQPQVRLADGALIGAEALLRWRHPQWGVLAPAAFMSVLETHLVAYEVGQWVLDETCRQLAAWRSRGLDVFRISCNLFGAQVHTRGLVTEVEAALARHGLQPADLELEITETIALRHDDETLQPLFALVERGIGIALDDFGTGFASLSTLKRAPLTRLKIDRSFVADVCADRHSAAVIGGILSIGSALDIDVIAEGVETHEQRTALQALGCTQGQGYLYGRPLDGEAFARRYSRMDSQCRPRRSASL
ncbi:putative bifunctional diguanylate cyclase/phosphodiesterase [uncultured Sphingomonas sp.]|uniref:putative bifunctional diguanylate cyclase/phosphodiesterase n=1 Tax=uncultured Sphingomonas sp. TaxID=158754 RepID=UPI0035C9B578